MATIDKKVLELEDAEIMFRNFAGEERQFNPRGKRNFCVIIDDKIADALLADGWNVRQTKPRDEDDSPRHYIQVQVNFKNKPPKVVIIRGSKQRVLDEEKIDLLDWAEIETADLIVSPYAWELNGRSGITAYLKVLYVVIAEDKLSSKYAEYEEE